MTDLVSISHFKGHNLDVHCLMQLKEKHAFPIRRMIPGGIAA